MAGFIDTHGEIIANNVKTDNPTMFLELAIELAPIVIKILGFLVDCAKNGGISRSASSGSPADYIADHYDSATDTFEPNLIGQVNGQTRRAIRQQRRENGGKRLRDFSQEEVTAISIATLKHAMLNPSAAVNCMTEVHN